MHMNCLVLISCCWLLKKTLVIPTNLTIPESASNISDSFVDKKLSIHIGEDKTKSILFSSKRNLKLVEELDITYKKI